jgi:hypothetical protein
MLINDDCMSPPAVAAGAVWAKAEEMNTEYSKTQGQKTVKNGLRLPHGTDTTAKHSEPLIVSGEATRKMLHF